MIASFRVVVTSIEASSTRPFLYLLWLLLLMVIVVVFSAIHCHRTSFNSVVSVCSGDIVVTVVIGPEINLRLGSLWLLVLVLHWGCSPERTARLWLTSLEHFSCLR